MTLTDNLVAWWDLAVDAAPWSDSVGGFPLTESGTVVSVAASGPGGQATAGFDDAAGGDYLSAGAGAAIPPFDYYSQGFSIAGWVKLSAHSTSQNVFAGHREAVSIYWMVSRYASGGKIHFLVGDAAGATQDVVAIAANSTGVWYWVCGTYDPSGTPTSRLYIDNVLQGSSTTALGAKATSNARLRLAMLSYTVNSAYRHQGNLGMLGLWTRILTSGERAELYNSGAGLQFAGFPPDFTSAYYGDFDPAVLKVHLTDGSGNLKANLVTGAYGGGIPDAPGELRPSLEYPDGRLKAGLTTPDGLSLKPSLLR